MCSWSRARMFTAKPLASSIAGRLRALRSTLKRTSGGSSETELNELMVRPMSPSPLPRAVTTATPVANSPRARLNARSCIGHLPYRSAPNCNSYLASLQSYLEMSSSCCLARACMFRRSPEPMPFAGRTTVIDALLTASKPELLDKDGDRTLRGLLYDYFAFGRGLESARETFASFAGLSATQYLILIAIKNSTAEEPMGVNQVAERLYLSGAFVTNEINKLVSDGLIEKNPHPGDGRRVQLSLTQHGVNRLIRLAALQRPVNDALFGMLTREEFRVLSGLLSRLASNADSALKLAEHVQAKLKSRENQRPSAANLPDSGKKRRATPLRNTR